MTRLTVGNCATTRPLSRLADSVWTDTAPLAASTVTCSDAVPTSSIGCSIASSLGFNSIDCLLVLKPLAVAVNSYCPAGSSVRWKLPSAPVVVCRVLPAASRRVTETPAMMAPLRSVMRPETPANVSSFPLARSISNPGSSFFLAKLFCDAAPFVSAGSSCCRFATFRPFNGKSDIVAELMALCASAASAVGAEADGAATVVCGATFAVASPFFNAGEFKPLAMGFFCRERFAAVAVGAKLFCRLADCATCSESVLGARSDLAVVPGRSISGCLTLAICCGVPGAPPWGRI